MPRVVFVTEQQAHLFRIREAADWRRERIESDLEAQRAYLADAEAELETELTADDGEPEQVARRLRNLRWKVAELENDLAEATAAVADIERRMSE